MDFAIAERRPADDVGTLWTMSRRGQVARCALIARSQGWELRVLVDGQLLMAERCQRGADTFMTAASLKQQMIRDGWLPVVPRPTLRRAS